MITIVPYQSSWPEEFLAIGRELRQALGDLALRIDHIGSTAVTGLAAKDRIDIQVAVANLSTDVESALNQIGYSRKPYNVDHAPAGMEENHQDWEKWFFSPPRSQRPTNLHVRVEGRANQRYALLFRDYLRTHPNTAQAYAQLKHQLAEYLADPDTYPDVKDPAVDLIFFAADAWAISTGWEPEPSDC